MPSSHFALIVILAPLVTSTTNVWVVEDEATTGAWRAEGAVIPAAGERDTLVVAHSSEKSFDDLEDPSEYPVEIPLSFQRPSQQVDTFYSRFIAWWSKHNPPKARVNCPIPYPFHIIGLLVHVLTPQLEGAPNLSYWILVALAALTLSVALLYIVVSWCVHRKATFDAGLVYRTSV